MPAAHSVIFLGTSAFAVPSLEALMKDRRFSPKLVVTQPDRPAGRGQALAQSPVKVAAQKYGLAVEQPDDISALSTHDTDFLVVVSYGQILPQTILDMPRIAPVNVHASLLPRWRGASPIQNAILSGDTETGVTVQKMALELDAGPILAQRKIPIGPRDTFMALHDRLARFGAELLVQTLAVPLHSQEQDLAHVTFCRKLTRDDGRADTALMTAEEIDRRVRALVPWPGVTVRIDGDELKLLETSLTETSESVPLPCKNSVLHLVSVQPPGKKPMSGKEWTRGKH
jgi:methionyl-tRNA formyltransferase